MSNQPPASRQRRPVERADREAGAADEELPAVEADLDGRVDRHARRAEVALATLHRHDASRLDLAVLLPKGDAERPEPAQGVGCDERSADPGIANALEPGLALHEGGHEAPGEPGAGAGAAAPSQAGVGGCRETAHRPVVGGALEPACMPHPQVDVAADPLEQSRGGHEHGRRRLDEVGRHGVERLREAE